MSATLGTNQGVSKRELLIFFYKYRLRLILSFAIPFILGVILSFIPAPRYVASSVLIVRLGAEYVYNPEVSDSQNGTSNLIPFNPSQIFKSEVAILDSEDLHADVIKSMGIYTIFPEMNTVSGYLYEKGAELLEYAGIMEKQGDLRERIKLARAVTQFDKRLDIMLEKESAVIRIAFENRDPEVAVKTLDTLIKLYLEKRKKIYSEDRIELALSERESSHKHALEAESAVQGFKRRHKIYALADEREQLLQRRNAAQEESSIISNGGLNARITDYTQQLEKLDSLEREYNLLQDDAKIAADSYALYSRKYDEAKALEDLERDRLDSVRVIQAPSVPAEPKPLQLWIILIGTFLSFVSLGVTAAVTESLRNGFYTAEQVMQALGLPVLSMFKKDTGRLSEDMQSLLYNPVVNIAEEGGIVTFISARKGEGVSYVAWNYAEKLSEEAGKKVLLIDAGEMSHENYKKYDFSPEVGIVDAIVSGDEFDKSINVMDDFSICRFICNEANRYQAANIINDNEVWKELAEIFDIVVIDAGNLQTYDSVLLAAKSTATVLVVESERTPQAVVKHLYDTLLSAGAKIRGVVINKRRYHIPSKIYKRFS